MGFDSVQPTRIRVMFWCLQLLLFLKGFTESDRSKLAMLTGILLANGNISASILSSLFNENLVKEGTSLSASSVRLCAFSPNVFSFTAKCIFPLLILMNWVSLVQGGKCKLTSVATKEPLTSCCTLFGFILTQASLTPSVNTSETHNTDTKSWLVVKGRTVGIIVGSKKRFLNRHFC